ncbi:uncharacterized protein LOC112604226 isoform X2 [Melanaphis sacchari]|uniref:uncharacterized protein LOC112604226 isoform X1 n=1 Tax=Melanaphis sacchari TaxID=742174 RepID=UPI000DC13A43|nr:uncharacterized protein LOC112604226 isoform X1 [Melanaphis sacchari]XP_025208950.1 uncharacterized protein LOC112604226 isoform X2 [Melanaphis sacchari]
MVHASRKYCQCFVLLYVIVLQTQAAVATNGDECWWTGCQPRTWAVVGCAQYNRTQLNVKECVGGSEYYCCTPDHRVVPSANDCWWTGCQPNSWAVKGCDSYNRTEKNRMACEWDGFRYECCARLETAVPNTHAVPDTHVVPDTYAVPDAHPDENCWWTGCQPNSWAVKGCDHYNRTEKNRMACEWDGFRYECCARPETTDPDIDIRSNFNDNCWWSECQPTDKSDRGCPPNAVRTGFHPCPGGDLLQCCWKNISTDGNM